MLPRTLANEAVFVVRNQMNYTVTERMQAMLDKEGMTVAEAAGVDRFRKILREREAEKKSNLEEFKQARGRDVRYGMVVQLQHAISQKVGSRSGGEHRVRRSRFVVRRLPPTIVYAASSARYTPAP